MDLNTATQYTMDLPNFHAEVTKVDGTRLIMQGPCVRQTNSEYPETWHQDYRVGKLVVIPKQGEPGFLVFSYQTMYEVSGRSALNKQPKVMTKTSGTEAPMTSVACVEPSNRIGLRVLEQYTCESLAKVEDQHTREEYWRYEEPLHKGWLPEKGIQISPEAYAEVEALSTELPAYQKAKKELFAKAREAGLFSTCVPKGLGVVDRQERGHIGYEGVGGSWMRVTLPEHHVSLVRTDFSLGGYSGALITEEVVAGDSMRQPFPRVGGHNMWAPAFTGRQANWPQDAAMIQKWGVDVNARINRVMTALFGPDMAVPEKIEAKYSRVEKEEERRFGGW